MFDSFTESYVALVAAGESLVFGAESAASAACSLFALLLEEVEFQRCFEGVERAEGTEF